MRLPDLGLVGRRRSVIAAEPLDLPVDECLAVVGPDRSVGNGLLKGRMRVVIDCRVGLPQRDLLARLQHLHEMRASGRIVPERLPHVEQRLDVCRSVAPRERPFGKAHRRRTHVVAERVFFPTVNIVLEQIGQRHRTNLRLRCAAWALSFQRQPPPSLNQ